MLKKNKEDTRCNENNKNSIWNEQSTNTQTIDISEIKMTNENILYQPEGSDLKCEEEELIRINDVQRIIENTL